MFSTVAQRIRLLTTQNVKNAFFRSTSGLRGRLERGGQTAKWTARAC
jgi:hypothetical protein